MVISFFNITDSRSYCCINPFRIKLFCIFLRTVYFIDIRFILLREIYVRIIFYCIIFVFIILFTLYLVSFFSIYTATKSLVLEAYIISIIEILLIKLVYGICLASLRSASAGNELQCLYKLVYILDKYLS